MLLSFSLSQQISCEKICAELQRVVELYAKQNSLDDCLLVIDIRKTTTDTSLIPKLEYQVEK